MRFKPLFLATALAASAATHGVSAAPCVGFGDVQDTDAFCGAVEWLKNRAVTLGCAATSYCPFDNVTRAQMALFMNRLGKALTPVVVHKEVGLNNIVVTAAEQSQCETTDLAVANHPRTARFRGVLWGHPTGSDAWLQGWWKYSTDGGLTWSTIGTLYTDQFPGRSWAAADRALIMPVLAPPLALAPGVTYRFALFLNNYGGMTPFTFNPLVCQAEVIVDNRNPAVSPLDE